MVRGIPEPWFFLSCFSGKSVFEFEEEVVGILLYVGSPLDDVESPDFTGMAQLTWLYPREFCRMALVAI